MNKIKWAAILLFVYNSFANAQNNQFIDFFGKIESLSANFTQQIYNQSDILINATSGRLAFNRPKQLKWHTIAPNEQILLLNDNQLWLIDVELEQAVLQRSKDLSKTPLYWLINELSVIADIPKFSHKQDGIDWYQANSNSSKYKQLNFGFEGQILRQISLKNALEKRVSIIFTEVLINPKINPQTFKLNLNSDFDIIR